MFLSNVKHTKTWRSLQLNILMVVFFRGENERTGSKITSHLRAQEEEKKAALCNILKVQRRRKKLHLRYAISTKIVFLNLMSSMCFSRSIFERYLSRLLSFFFRKRELFISPDADTCKELSETIVGRVNRSNCASISETLRSSS